LADARILIDYARDVSLSHRFLYDEPIDVEFLTKIIQGHNNILAGGQDLPS
jgi:proteasome alpha subunit